MTEIYENIPQTCPRCGSDALENDEEFYDDVYGEFTQIVFCPECDFKWKLYYTFQWGEPVE